MCDMCVCVRVCMYLLSTYVPVYERGCAHDSRGQELTDEVMLCVTCVCVCVCVCVYACI